MTAGALFEHMMNALHRGSEGSGTADAADPILFESQGFPEMIISKVRDFRSCPIFVVFARDFG